MGTILMPQDEKSLLVDDAYGFTTLWMYVMSPSSMFTNGEDGNLQVKCILL